METAVIFSNIELQTVLVKVKSAAKTFGLFLYLNDLSAKGCFGYIWKIKRSFVIYYFVECMIKFGFYNGIWNRQAYIF